MNHQAAVCVWPWDVNVGAQECACVCESVCLRGRRRQQDREMELVPERRPCVYVHVWKREREVCVEGEVERRCLWVSES